MIKALKGNLVIWQFKSDMKYFRAVFNWVLEKHTSDQSQRPQTIQRANDEARENVYEVNEAIGWFYLTLLPIGWKSGPSFLNQSQSVVKW